MLGKRHSLDSLADENWDLIVIGGGITGAGVLLEAARRGHRVLLLEQTDFAWGTSSRSSKMVHGGLRYIAQGDIRLTRHSLLERERLIEELPGLVERATYLFPLRKGVFPGRWPMKAILWLYDFLAGIRDHRYLSREQLLERVPGLNRQSLTGAMSYTDALTDDCRLVVRAILEAARHGGVAQNYCRVEQAMADGDKFAITVTDRTSGQTATLSSRRVVSATGAWADRFSGSDPRVRPLRGSHLFVDPERLPVKDCLTVMHPDDGRPVFVFPWEGVTCVGTTDLDHPQDMDIEAAASGQEVDYLLRLINSQFPDVKLDRKDIYATIAGVRPVIASGKGLDPSKERQGDPVFIQWILDNEDVVHLDDLMLRRTRLGLLLPQAGKSRLDALQQQIQQSLGWDDQRWQEERARYLDIHQRYYGVPASPLQQAAG